jgi:hypothetical protein
MAGRIGAQALKMQSVEQASSVAQSLRRLARQWSEAKGTTAILGCAACCAMQLRQAM